MSHQIDVQKILLLELMEDSPDYIFIKDRQSRFVITNKAQAQLLLGLEDPGECVNTLRVDGPCVGMNITGFTGLTEAQMAALPLSTSQS